MSDNTHTSPELPPPGWYPDPHDSTGKRYWDGARWTEHAAVSAANAATHAAQALVGTAV